MLSEIIVRFTFGLRYSFEFAWGDPGCLSCFGELPQWTMPAILEWQTKMTETILPVLKGKLAPNAHVGRDESKEEKKRLDPEGNW